MQLLHETLDTLIEAFQQLLQSDSLSFIDRQTDKSKDLALKQHYLGRKNNLVGYHCPN